MKYSVGAIHELPLPSISYLAMIAATNSHPCADNNYHQAHVLMLLENLYKWTGYDLAAAYGFSADTIGREIFAADLYILSHNNAIEPVLNYGNQRVLELWEVSWAELTAMYSKDTAKNVDRAARSTTMAHVKQHNYVTGYHGTRVSKTGKEFQIIDVTIWNLFTDDGLAYGQAAWFKSIDRDINARSASGNMGR
jgi:hypothetical protein